MTIKGLSHSVIISVDFELFSDTFAFQKLDLEWDHGENGETGVNRLLELFERNGVRSTFFVAAQRAGSHSDLIADILGGGHEIASHTATHRKLSTIDDTELITEIYGSKKVLEEATGTEVIGFRAPAFMIDKKIAQIVYQSGYQYDSSVVPSLHIPKWYGYPMAPRYPFLIGELFSELDFGLVEFPIATNPLTRTPVSGLWMRLFGVQYTLWGIKSQLKRGEIPVLYVHPWELVDLPRIKGIPRGVYYRTGDTVYRMLEYIIRNIDADFVSMKDLILKHNYGP